MKAEFKMMTLRELKQYVLEHRSDRAAFQALMERIDAQPQKQVYSDVDADGFSQLLERHYPSISPN